MLKIKDNVDLEELKKFGFKYEKKKYYIETARDLMDSETNAVFPVSKRFAIYVNVNDRKVTITKNIVCWQNQSKVDIIFDLIKADFIEKV